MNVNKKGITAAIEGPVRIVPIPLLRDNYAYALVDESRQAAIVDPSEGDAVIQILRNNEWSLSGIWLTHHHADHVGGVDAIWKALGPVPVYGSAWDHERSRIPHQTVGLSEGDIVNFGSHEVRALAIPGHTLGAIAYFTEGHLFSGDTLFIAGCGRLFEGTMEQMWTSLQKLAALPAETGLWCGHEYAVRNLEFAHSVEPDNRSIEGTLAEARRKAAQKEPSVPSTMGIEREINPFMRCHIPSLAKGRTPFETFTSLRKAKDLF